MTHFLPSFLLALVLLVPAVAAQETGDCAPGTADAYLDVNDVRARLFNTGSLFWRGSEPAVAQYFVPKATERAPIFAESVQFAGKVDGEVRAATGAFHSNDYWPGPLGEGGTPPEDCASYDRIYLVGRGDIEQYDETGIATDELRDWPADLGAPVIDGDGVEGNYDLAGGDRPAISGEQMAWWVMNDAGNEHRHTGSPPVGLEVRVSAFATPSTRPALHQATFYRYEITYRGSQPLDSAYVALWSDSELWSGSDFVGSDTTLDLGFTYDSREGGGPYGVPPAVGVKVLRGPVGLPNGRDDDGDGEVDEPGERLGMTAFSCYLRTVLPMILNAAGLYNCMRGRWSNGDPITVGGYGHQSGEVVTTIALPGDPVTQQFWSEERAFPGGGNNEGFDRHFTVVTGPFRMEPGETEEVVFAIPFAQGTDRLDSVARLRDAARYVQNAYDLGALDSQPLAGAPPTEPLHEVALARPFPNPFRDAATLTLRVPEHAGPIHLAVYDVLGREVAVLADGVLPPGEHALTLDGAGLPSGLYLVRLEAGRQTETIKLLHVE